MEKFARSTLHIFYVCDGHGKQGGTLWLKTHYERVGVGKPCRYAHFLKHSGL